MGHDHHHHTHDHHHHGHAHDHGKHGHSHGGHGHSHAPASFDRAFAIGAAFGGHFGVTTSSGPGVALKQEAIGLAVAAELPASADFATGRANFNQADFEAAVDRVSTVSSERGRAVKLSLAGGKLMLSVTNPDSGSATEELEVEYDSDPIDIGFNSRYLLDITEQITGSDARFLMADAGSPTLVRDGADDERQRQQRLPWVERRADRRRGGDDDEPAGPAPKRKLDPLQARAESVGLHPDLSRVLLAKLTPDDFRNAATAIKMAVTDTPDDGTLEWPRQRKPARPCCLAAPAAAKPRCICVASWMCCAPTRRPKP